MSETLDNQTAHALLCFNPTPALTQPSSAEIEPVTPPSSDAETPIPQTMGNAQSGEGSLRRRIKKKAKKEEKGKIGIATALFSDPVLGASGMGAYGGTPVDEAATPNKRKRQAEQPKSPRPIRSTYDNVHQSGSITSLTSDLFLDTVSRLDVSMTTSQAEIAGMRHHVDPQTFDSISYGGMSLAESGFITPALTTPQVQRNQLAGAGTMTTSDSVSELGKEIERTIFERLSANQKAGTAEAQPEASVSSSPKSNEVKMTLVMRSPIPPRKTVTEVKPTGVSPRTAKLEIIESSAEPKPLKPVVESRIELDLRTAQSAREEDVRKPEISDGTDKADNELMEKECKPDKKRTDPDEDQEERMKTKEKHKELGVNGPSSSSDENCGDFEVVKLHIEEEDLLVVPDQEEKVTSTRVEEVEASGHSDIGAGQATTITDRNPDHKQTTSVAAAGQQSTLVKPEVPKEDVGEREIQIKPMDKQQKTEKPAGTSVGGRRRRERTKVEASKEGEIETTGKGNQKSEPLITSQAPGVESSEETAYTAATVVAAAAVVTKPLESTGRTVVLPQAEEKVSLVQTGANVSVVDTPKAACEELIQATNFASVEQAQVIIRRPVFQHDQKIHDNKDLTETERTEGQIELDPKSKYGPNKNLGPGVIDHKNIQKEDEKTEELKEKTEEKDKEKTSITPSEQRVSAETDKSLTKEHQEAKEQSLLELEAGKIVVSTSNTDEIPTTTNMEDPPKEEATAEKSSGEATDRSSKSKKDRKRKRKKGKRQSMDASDVTTTETEAKEMSEREDASSRKEDDVTVSSKENTEKSTTDESGDNCGTAFEKHALQQQTTVIERTSYKEKYDDENLEETDDRPVDACDLLLQSEEFRNQKPCKTETPESVHSHHRKETPRVPIDTNLTVECPANSDILSDEPTPTNDRSNQVRAFYVPDRIQKSRAKLFCVADSEQVKVDESENDIAEQGEQRDVIRRQEYDEHSSGSELKPSGSPPTSEEKNNGENEPTDNVVAKDCPEGTNMKTEQKRNLRISLTSEEVSEIFENSQTRLEDEVRSNNRPLIHYQDVDDEVKDISNGFDRNGVEDGEGTSDDEDHWKKRTKNISNLTLSDIDSSLPETLPELADLQNFLEYIKVGEQPTRGDTPPFSPRGETGRSSPNENSNSRRLSRISPAVTERSITESDLDISEQRDDLSTDSNIFADDEDESSSELLFTKTYTEPDKGGEVCVSCTVVSTNVDEDSDEFWAENSATEEVYQRIESSTKAVTTVFDNARLQMQDIHSHLHNLRLQMESLQESLDNASILSQEYYNMDNDQVTSQEFYSQEKELLVSQEYFSRSRRAPVTPEDYSPVDIGPVLTEEYYSSTLGKPPLL